MNDLTLMVVMLSGFVAVVYGSHALVQRLRRKGHGARLDALHRATVRVQGGFLRSAGAVFRAARPNVYQPRAPTSSADDSSTKQD